jgi:hypothetical protein
LRQLFPGRVAKFEQTMPSAILSLRVTRSGIVGGGGLAVITYPARVAETQQVATLDVRDTIARPPSCGKYIAVSRTLFSARRC